jgi:hypothetical protein
MLNPDAKEFLPDYQLFLPDISVFYDKKDLLIPFLFKKPSGSRKRGVRSSHKHFKSSLRSKERWK